MTPDPTTPEGRQELRRLSDRATQGPWRAGQRKLRNRPPVDTHPGLTVICASAPGQGVFTEHRSGTSPASDDAFIAAARSALPAALDHIDALEARMKEAVGHHVDQEIALQAKINALTAERDALKAAVARLEQRAASARAATQRLAGVDEVSSSAEPVRELRQGPSNVDLIYDLGHVLGRNRPPSLDECTIRRAMERIQLQEDMLFRGLDVQVALADRVKKAESERDELRAANEWRPIETAPSNGEMFEAITSSGLQVIANRRANTPLGMVLFHSPGRVPCTHWRPARLDRPAP